MHSGFRPLREHLSMALLERHPKPEYPQANADIARIEKIWRECRETWGKAGGGPFLFGHWTVADAMYAPVVTRFRTYGVRLGRHRRGLHGSGAGRSRFPCVGGSGPARPAARAADRLTLRFPRAVVRLRGTGNLDHLDSVMNLSP